MFGGVMKTLLVMCAVLLSLPCIALAAPVPDTGQTICYDAQPLPYAGEIPCPNPGDDFYGQDAQYGPNVQSFTKLDENGNDLPDDAPWPWAMVRDNVTALVWEVKTDDGSIHDKDNSYNWYGAQDVFIATLNGQNFGGHNDWRLPTVKELSSIVNRDWHDPAINTTFFPNTRCSYYWSSTTVIGWSSLAWVADFCNGYNGGCYELDYFYLRAVRGGQCGSFGNYIDNGDGTITDTGTGLMWQKDEAPGYYYWQQALLYCENLILASHDDWRLPNANELQTIVDYSRVDPSIDIAFFPNTRWSYSYWSSTTIHEYPYLAWAVDFGSGYFEGSVYKRGYGYVRAVRAGSCESFDDLDADCRMDCIDNCPSTPNCLDSGICIRGAIAQPCTSNEQCGSGGLCSMQQEDTDSDYSGDACDDCTDTDKDGYGNPEFIINTCPDDNCPNAANPGQEDEDSDGVGTVCDNCPYISNLGQNDVDHDCVGDVCDNCFSISNPLQDDTYPPGGNGIGDACDCEGNFTCSIDQNVDGMDAATFKADFGRSIISNPCTNAAPCNGDFSCNGNVDGLDAALLKQDFGRSTINNPCPVCTSSEPWCSY